MLKQTIFAALVAVLTFTGTATAHDYAAKPHVKIGKATAKTRGPIAKVSGVLSNGLA